MRTQKNKESQPETKEDNNSKITKKGKVRTEKNKESRPETKEDNHNKIREEMKRDKANKSQVSDKTKAE